MWRLLDSSQTNSLEQNQKLPRHLNLEIFPQNLWKLDERVRNSLHSSLRVVPPSDYLLSLPVRKSPVARVKISLQIPWSWEENRTSRRSQFGPYEVETIGTLDPILVWSLRIEYGRLGGDWWYGYARFSFLSKSCLDCPWRTGSARWYDFISYRQLWRIFLFFLRISTSFIGWDKAQAILPSLEYKPQLCWISFTKTQTLWSFTNPLECSSIQARSAGGIKLLAWLSFARS